MSRKPIVVNKGWFFMCVYVFMGVRFWHKAVIHEIEKRTSKEGANSYRVKIRLKGYPAQTASFERLFRLPK